MKISKIDDYGVREYSPIFKILIGFVILYTYILIMSYPLMVAEGNSATANIKTYRDAFWLLQMAASTIGFGDFYPTSEVGRLIVVSTFYVGVGIAGFIGGTIASIFTSFTETSIKNRELKKQNSQILEEIKKLNKKEEKIKWKKLS